MIKVLLYRTKFRVYLPFFLGILLFIAILFANILNTTRQAQEISSHIYLAPEGCLAHFPYGRYLSKKCANRNYEISRFLAISRHWYGKNKYASWYRINNDAVEMSCNYFSDTCDVSSVYRDVFSVNN